MINFVVLICCFLGIFLTKTGASKCLFIMFFVSISFSILLGNNLPLSMPSLYYSTFVCSILFILFYSFNYLDAKNISSYYVSNVEMRLLRFLFRYSILGVVTNFYIFSEMMINFFLGNISIEVFKNGGYGLDYYNQVNIIPRLISAALSPLSYLCLPLHFYFLAHQQTRLASIAFLGSLSIILDQLAFFGRGGIVVFVMVYIVMFVFIFPVLSRKLKIKITLFALSFLLPIGAIFIYISNERFTMHTGFDYNGYVDNQIIVSILSYYSQWFSNGFNLYTHFDLNEMTYFSNFMYLPDKLMGLLGFSLYDLIEVREVAFGSQATYFNGLPILMLYDLHYIGSYIITLSFFVFFKVYFGSKSSNYIDKYKFIIAGLLIPVPVMFFQGLHTVHGGYNTAFVYFILFYFFSKSRTTILSGHSGNRGVSSDPHFVIPNN